MWYMYKSMIKKIYIKICIDCLCILHFKKLLPTNNLFVDEEYLTYLYTRFKKYEKEINIMKIE